MRSTRGSAAAVLAAAFTFGGCGSSSQRAASGGSTGGSTGARPAAASPAASGPVTIAIANYAYAPASLTVKPGTKLTFVNHDATAHTATASGSPAFDTGTVKAGGSATVTLTTPGTYSYICQFHPFMKGSITVGS